MRMPFECPTLPLPRLARLSCTRTVAPLAVALALLVLPRDLRSQAITGRVLEQSTGSPLAGVSLQLRGPATGNAVTAQTDAQGRFSLKSLGAGSVFLTAAHRDYQTLVRSLVLEPDQTVVLELAMERQAIVLDTVVAAAHPLSRIHGFYERVAQPGFGRFITREDIERRPSTTRVTDLLRGVVGLELEEVRRGRGQARVTMVLMRGAYGRCQPTIYIDGMSARQFTDSGIDDFLKPGMLEGVEIYTRAASVPSDFAAPASCGVLAFWSRSGSSEGATRWTLKRVLSAAAIASVMVGVLVFGLH